MRPTSHSQRRMRRTFSVTRSHSTWFTVRRLQLVQRMKASMPVWSAPSVVKTRGAQIMQLKTSPPFRPRVLRWGEGREAGASGWG